MHRFALLMVYFCATGLLVLLYCSKLQAASQAAPESMTSETPTQQPATTDQPIDLADAQPTSVSLLCNITTQDGKRQYVLRLDVDASNSSVLLNETIIQGVTNVVHTRTYISYRTDQIVNDNEFTADVKIDRLSGDYNGRLAFVQSDSPRQMETGFCKRYSETSGQFDLLP